MPRSGDQLTEEEKKLLQLNESMIKANMQSSPALISIEPLTRKTWDERQRPQKAINIFRKLTQPQRQALMFALGQEGNEEELKSLIQGYLKGMNFREQQQKAQAEKYKEKMKGSTEQQQDLEWNILHFGIHLDVEHIRKRLDEIAETTGIDTLSDLFEKSTKRKLNLNLNDVEWNTLSNWLAGHVETAKIRALQKLDRKLEASGLLKKKEESYPKYVR